MPQGHGLQDLDNLILTLIRTPVFSEKVNDIEFECGNSLYQPVLDRYIAERPSSSRKCKRCGGKLAWCHAVPKPPDPKLPDPELARQVQGCLERKASSKAPK
jgi:hypothetical protein